MAKSLPVYWAPHPGKQALAATCPVDEILFAGTRGGGKSDTLIGRHLRGATKYGVDWHGLIARKKYKDLGDIKRKFDALIAKGMPAERIGGEAQTNLVRFKAGPAKGAEIVLTAFQHVKQLDDWQGFEFAEVSIDEAPQISYIATVIDKMRGTLRSKKDIHTAMFLTGNPGGPGASTLKMLYKLTEPTTWGKIQNVEVRFDLGNEEVIENISRVYLHSILEDNPSINARDYKKKLAAISDKALLEAWLRGDWNVTIGQAFYIDFNRHVIDPIWPIPDYAPIYMTFDWGYGAPFSIGWWWVDNDNRVYRFAEWYGWDGKNPNRGLRLTDREIAKGVLERETAMGIRGRRIDRLTGPDSFRRKPNYLGGGQGPSTADEFNSYAESGEAYELFGGGMNREEFKKILKMRPGDADRPKKLRQFRNRLQLPANRSEMPMMVIYKTCEQWLRTVPSVSLDEDNIEVIEDGQEDHTYDDSCHICMARPIGADVENLAREAVIAAQSQAVAQLDNASRAAAQELFYLQKRIAEQSERAGSDIILDPRSVGLRSDDFDDEFNIDAEDMFRSMPSLAHLFGKR